MKKIFSLIGVLLLMCLLQSCNELYYSSGSYNSYNNSTDAYSTPVQPNSGTCAACGGRGYIIRNGQKETCSPCNGTGKAVSFPEPKK